MKQHEPKYKRGFVILDDDFSRLYIVLKTQWDSQFGVYNYRVLIVANWSDGENRTDNHPGQRVNFGNGVERDKHVGFVELPDDVM